jgi:8-oxo-dGTP pyrophosphatase MutT (NUDIX family)
MIGDYLAKVTAFVTRQAAGGEMLLFRHPYAGVQFPAGTVEEGETLEQAVLREVAEETGLENVRIVARIGQRDELPPGVTHVILHTTRVYSRPSLESFDWAGLRRGIAVRLLRRQGGFAQVTYEESDFSPNPTYLSYQITGWVPEERLARANRRTFFHLELVGEAPDQWEQRTDSHRFSLFWVPLGSLDRIESPQKDWLDLARDEFGYRFA